MHEVSTKQCNRVTKALRCVTSEVCDLPFYDVIGNVVLLLEEFEKKVPEEQRYEALDFVLRSTPARWWGAHYYHFVILRLKTKSRRKHQTTSVLGSSPPRPREGSLCRI